VTNFKPRFAFQEYEAGNGTYLNELDARKPLVVSISQKSEELRLHNLDLEFDNFKPWPKSSIFKCISCLNSSLLRVMVAVL
jgi:hypothetical protein